jgi:hypothetical protein
MKNLTTSLTTTSFDLDATVEAIRILRDARVAVATKVPSSVWTLLAHAGDRLDAEVKAYFRPEAQ